MKLNFSIAIPNWLDRIFTYPLLNYRLLRHGYPFRRIKLNENQYTTVDPANFYRLNKFDWFCFGKDENLYAARLVRLKSGRLKILLMHRQIFFRSAENEANGVSQSFEFRKKFLRDAAETPVSYFPFREMLPGQTSQSFLGVPQGRRPRRSLQFLKEILAGQKISENFYCEANEPHPTFFPRSNLFNLSPGQIDTCVVDHINTTSLDNRLANLRLATPSQNSCNSRRNKLNTYSKFRGVSFSKRKSKWFSAIRINGKKKWLGYFDNELDAALAYDAEAKKYHGEFAVLNFND